MGRLIRTIKNPHSYIKFIKDNENFGIENITVEHRSNNPKRDYLFVNKKQCKHIPSSPTDMINMCKILADKVNNTLANTLDIKEKVLVIGFAETATAIGNFVADNLCCDTYVLQTTREDVDKSIEIIRFEEEHSHATTQKLLTYEENPINLDDYAYVLFVEDEISTGNTILNFINAFEKVHPGFKYGVASICNWQNTDDHNKFVHRNIDIFALITGELIDKNMKMLTYNEEINLVNSAYKQLPKLDGTVGCKPICKGYAGDDLFRTTRLGHDTHIDLSKVYEHLDKHVLNTKIQSVRVIGTEEFMYIPISIGAYIESKGIDVICHSTTRSPIDVLSRKDDVGTFECVHGLSDTIRSKYRVHSVYSDDRKTFLYNVEEYTDLVIIVTDTDINNEEILNNYYNTLIKYTNSIVLVTL